MAEVTMARGSSLVPTIKGYVVFYLPVRGRVIVGTRLDPCAINP